MSTAGDDDRDLPPYDDRQKGADVDQTGSHREGARVGGATGPVEDDEMKDPEPESTPGGRTASPADEQPAADMPENEPSDPGTGPAHEPGTGRAENRGS
ncbi:MAG: hypothetical protein M3Q87_02915 [Actinomycetota bacterium]|nr:hypothetical protein [Actinomycetota bacterium]